MNFSEESDIDLIERYLRDELTSEERIDFMNRMKGDPEFAEKTEDYAMIIQGIANQGATAFRRELTAWENEIRHDEMNLPRIRVSDAPKKEKPSMPLSSWSRYFSIAAAVAALLVALLYVIDYKKDRKLNELFAAHFSPHDELLSTRGNGTHVTLAEALESYNAKNFAEAVSRFEQYLKENPNDYQAWFYFGVSQLAAGKNSDAVTSFDVVIDRKIIFRDSAEWYKALALIKLNDASGARKLLSQIASTEGHDYREKADALLREL